VGFRARKSFKLAPGVRMTVSKSGVGYSVGGKGVRLTKRARGGWQGTVSAPGTGLSYTSSLGRSGSRRRTAGSRKAAVQPQRGSVELEAARRARAVAPMSRRIKIERALSLIGIACTFVGFVVVPVLAVAVPCMLVGLVMMLANFKGEMDWYRRYKEAKAQAVADFLAGKWHFGDA
jgi:Protein of unknown function (DUF4236)